MKFELRKCYPSDIVMSKQEGDKNQVRRSSQRKKGDKNFSHKKLKISHTRRAKEKWMSSPAAHYRWTSTLSLSLSPLLSPPLLNPHQWFPIYCTTSNLRWDPLLRVLFKPRDQDGKGNQFKIHCLGCRSGQDGVLFVAELQAKEKNKLYKGP